MAVRNAFRELLYSLDDPRLVLARSLDARGWSKAVHENPLAEPMLADWRALQREPYHGLTCDGRCERGLFALADEGVSTAGAVASAAALLQLLDGDEQARVRHAIDADEWRGWSNPEFILNDFGLRLEDLAEPKRHAILAVIEASLSAKGYRKARDCMRVNAFLGELTGLPAIMNEWSYHFLLFGDPDLEKPWGWSLYGHHLALNCFMLGSQMVLSPTFMGAEPNMIDVGPYAGTKLFLDEESVGLDLMRSLTPELQQKATVYAQMVDPAMPEGRLHPGDERHLGGAFRDNRIVPYEGIPASTMDARQREKLIQIAAAFLEYLPREPLAHKLRHIEQHLDRTFWSWIGGHGDDDPFYYRIQSPVIMLEFDHHSGIWLNNQQPAKCHIHTVVRTPNGNDYGKDLLRLHYAETHPGRQPGSE